MLVTRKLERELNRAKKTYSIWQLPRLQWFFTAKNGLQRIQNHTLLLNLF